MKSIICFILSILIFSDVEAQQPKVSDISVSIPTITINAKLIGKDSVIIPYDAGYYIVQDNCAQIIRHGHYDFKNKTFVGKFTDVKKDDTTQIIAEGSYKNVRLKNGLFVMHYMNGKLKYRGEFDADKPIGKWEWYYPNGVLEAVGNFKDDKYIGNWNFYYDNGKPQFSFVVKKDICVITDAWAIDGIKMVNNGNGNYNITISNTKYEWSGKLTNGLPDSAWIYHATSGNDSTIIVTEYFQDSHFIRGTTQFGGSTLNYQNESHISLFPAMPSFIDLNEACFLPVDSRCGDSGEGDCNIQIWGKTMYHRVININGIIAK